MPSECRQLGGVLSGLMAHGGRYSLLPDCAILSTNKSMGGIDETSFIRGRCRLYGEPVAGRRSCPGYGQDRPDHAVFRPIRGRATQMDDGVKLYLKQHGDKLGGINVEIIRKDTGGINPAVAKRLAQELVTRDNVDIFAGFVLTPNALAAADISVEAKKFMVVMNAATAIITTKSPYMVRTSLTVPQLTQTLGTWAEKNGLKKAYTMVTDYGPGIDAEDAFQKGFKEAGGDVVGSVRMAVQNPDFTAYVQRAKDLNPQGIFVMIPGGAQPGAFGKAALAKEQGRKIVFVNWAGAGNPLGALKAMGPERLGINVSTGGNILPALVAYKDFPGLEGA